MKNSTIKRKLTLKNKRAIAGYLFIMPFIIGIFAFVLIPLIQSFQFSLNELEVTQDGYGLIWKGIENYRFALFTDVNFVRTLAESVQFMVTTVPLVIIFSFFAANLINQRFKGRTIVRAVFFLPVILTTGIIIAIENSDLMLNLLKSSFEAETGQTSSNILNNFQLRDLLRQTKLNPNFINYIISAIDRIYEIIIASGVQIMIFLAGLQSIPPSLFEASNIEGATGWENFWKITFPMISPLILVNMVYTIIDTMTKPNNKVMQMIHETAFRQTSYGLSASLAWIYFVIIIVMLGISLGIVSRYVFYQE